MYSRKKRKQNKQKNKKKNLCNFRKEKDDKALQQKPSERMRAHILYKENTLE